MGGIARMARQKQAGGPRHAAELPAAQGVGGGRDVGPRLDLDEGQDAAAARDDVDFTELGLVAPGQDRIAGESQPPYRAPLRDMPQPVGSLADLSRHETASRFRSSARA